MSNNCTTKYIDEFCEYFNSLDISINSGGESTLEIEYVGGAPATIKNELTEKYFPLAKNFVPAEWKGTSGPSGSTSTVTYYDPATKWANTMTIGLNGKGPIGDLNIGSEYFTVTGMPSHPNGGASRPIMFTSQGYLALWPGLDRKKDRYIRYLDDQGNIRSLDPENDADKIYLEDFHTPGYPDPYIEFGEWRYSTGELLSAVKTGGILPSHENSSIGFYGGMPSGFWQDTGTVSSVMNGIASAASSVFTSSTLLGHSPGEGGLWSWSAGFGGQDRIHDAGIHIPTNAVSSSITISDFDSYSSGSSMVSMVTGRIADERPEDMGDYVGSNGGGTGRHENSGNEDKAETRDASYQTSPVNVFGEMTEVEEEEWVWLQMKDLSIINEYGVALICEEGEEIDNVDTVKALYGDEWGGAGRKIYKGCKTLVSNGDPMTKVKEKLFTEIGGEKKIFNENSLALKVENYRRYHKATEIGGKHINRGGDPPGTRRGGNRYNGKVQEYHGYENYGSMDHPTGPKSWFSTNGGTVSFLEASNNLSETQFSEVEAAGEYDLEGGGPSGSPVDGGNIETVGDLMQMGDYSIQNGQGVIIVDFGPVSIPTFNGVDDVNFTKDEVLFDFTPSLFDTSKQVLGGVASVNTEALEASVKKIKTNYTKILKKCLLQNPAKGGTITAYGSEMFSDSQRNKTFEPGQARGVGERYNPGVKKFTKQLRQGPWTRSCAPDPSAFNRDWNQSTSEHALQANGQYNFSEGANVERRTHSLTCDGSVFINRLTKISFTLVNELYDFGSYQNHMKFLDSVSINVSNGKLTASYTFSEKVMVPSYRKSAEGSASLQNFNAQALR
jgi:hypothetical protein